MYGKRYYAFNKMDAVYESQGNTAKMTLASKCNENVIDKFGQIRVKMVEIRLKFN